MFHFRSKWLGSKEQEDFTLLSWRITSVSSCKLYIHTNKQLNNFLMHFTAIEICLWSLCDTSRPELGFSTHADLTFDFKCQLFQQMIWNVRQITVFLVYILDYAFLKKPATVISDVLWYKTSSVWQSRVEEACKRHEAEAASRATRPQGRHLWWGTHAARIHNQTLS